MGIKSTELGGTQKAVFLVLCMLLAIAPLSNVSAEDIGPPTSLQAQDINAIFDPLSETTSITWRNIDSDGIEVQGRFEATYNACLLHTPDAADNPHCAYLCRRTF